MDGSAAEDQALRFLQQRGLKLLARNWRCKLGELDLVMQDGDTVAVVEVRSRARTDRGTAAETVDRRKQARLVRATQLWLARQPHLAEQPLRFDLVTLDAGELEWRQEAFDVEG
ncbi:MAG: YraN family protein [Nevskiaceae bacterium]